MKTDTTFITNEGEQNLKERFKVLIKDTRFFDVLVGYFYTSGFHAVYKSLEKTEKIRILIGMGTSKQTYELIQEAQEPVQATLEFSHAETKDQFSSELAKEMEHSEDNSKVAEGVKRFVEWIKNGKLEIKAYPSSNIHAKLYIMTFVEGDKDVGRVITGSSNFTQAGFIDNLEFNVELKDSADYDFALKKFNELWADAVDLKDIYIDTIQSKTWLNDTITPYELYLKFLYEYFGGKINRDQESTAAEYFPEGYMDLAYQNDAVIDAKNKLDEYGGVFISDVVGLGKTYVCARLAQELDGRHLVIAPPVLIDEHNPGSWRNVFHDFNISAKFKSLGMLDELIQEGTDRYKNVFIDEAHRFRTESTATYEKLAQICRGKRVILVSATPLNNSPRDILSQIKLFQKGRKSTIPNLPNLEAFFAKLNKALEDLDRQADYEQYMRIVAENAKEIRERILKYLMIRRTRSEVVKYFEQDLKQQGLKFPDVADPEPFLYQLSEREDDAFNKTIKLLTQEFMYARYTPMLYYRGKITQPEELAEKNMRKFMKILMVKRLESSFYAFRLTLARFIKSYEQFIREYEAGHVYVSKDYTGKLFELLEKDDDESIQRMLDEKKARKYNTADFDKDFKTKLDKDLSILKKVDELWKTVKRDPKLIEFLHQMKTKKILKSNKVIIFTESKETAEYITEHLNEEYPGQVVCFSGDSGAAVRDKVIANFDARANVRENAYRILVSTEVLSEGVNLHRSNIVINYDIPWNPARLMQRVGRINRVDTKFDTIYTFNFFPTTQSNDAIKLKEAAEAKIQAFIDMLGTDARLLTEGEEIKSHDLFAKLLSKKTVTGEDEEEESELKYLKAIREIRDSDPALFERIKRLPKKARSGKSCNDKVNTLLTYFRKGKLQKFYAAAGKAEPLELDFLSAAQKLEATPASNRLSAGADFYDLLAKNKQAFIQATEEDQPEPVGKGGRDATTKLIRIIKAIRHYHGLTEDDETYLRDVMRLLEEGALTKQTLKNLIKAMNNESSPLKILGHFRMNIPAEFFKEHIAESAAQTAGPREVILSEYLAGR